MNIYKRSHRFQPADYTFFDESSVVKTTGNRRYGSARLGERAVEIQRYASNATYTINSLHSLVGVDCFNVLDGASNGEELLNFFDDALQVERADGSAALERSDVVVMDNCGFHHAHHVEPLLRQMLADCSLRKQTPFLPLGLRPPNVWGPEPQREKRRLLSQAMLTVELVYSSNQRTRPTSIPANAVSIKSSSFFVGIRC